MNKRVLLGAFALLCVVAQAQTQIIGSNVACVDVNGNTIPGCGSSAKPLSASLFGITSSGTPAGYTDAGTNLSTAVSGCSAANGIQVSQQINVGSSVTIPYVCAVKFVPGGELIPASGVTVTINGTVQAPTTQQVFNTASGGAVAGLTGDIPVEWFGATSNGSLSSGTDTTAAIQATLNALVAGHAYLSQPAYYHISSAIQVNKTDTGIKGVSSGYSYPNTSPVSLLVQSSASADIVDDTAANWSDLRDFSVQRAVAPTGSAKGISLNNAGGATVDHVQSQDSIYGFYLRAAAQNGVGGIHNSNAGWGFAGVTGYGGTLVGFYLDSTDGTPEYTLNMDNLGVANNLGTGPTTYGIYANGSGLEDVDVRFVNTALTTFGLAINYTGSGAQGTAYDFHVENGTFDNCSTNCVQVNGIPGNGSIVLTDLYATGNASANPAIAINNSYNVQINGAEVANVQAGGGIFVTGGGSNILNAIQGVVLLGGNGILLEGGTTNNIISNAVIKTQGTAMASQYAAINSSTGNQFVNIVGTGSATNGVYFDSSSTGNGLCNFSVAALLNGAASTCSGGSGGSGGGASSSTYLTNLTYGSGSNTDQYEEIINGGIPIVFGELFAAQGIYGYDAYYNASSWVAPVTGAPAGWRFGALPNTDSPGNGYQTGNLLFECPGQAAGTIAGMDTSCVALTVAPGMDSAGNVIHRFIFNRQTDGTAVTPGTNVGQNAVLTVNPDSTPDSKAVVQINAKNVADKGLVVQGVSGQTGNLQEWQMSGGAATWWVGPDGIMRTKDTSTGKTCVLNVTNGTLTPTCN